MYLKLIIILKNSIFFLQKYVRKDYEQISIIKLVTIKDLCQLYNQSATD